MLSFSIYIKSLHNQNGGVNITIGFSKEEIGHGLEWMEDLFGERQGLSRESLTSL
jgi:uncharacterized protein Smg (DUF494 family)